MKIVLIGFMGSGKSAVAKALGKKLNLPVVEMDDEIVKIAGKSIPEIFDNDGEIVFREIEMGVAKSLSEKENLIISTGGGVVMNKLNIDYLGKNGVVVYLESAFEEIVKRIGGRDDRPLFKHPDSAKSLYKFRVALYQQYANKIQDTQKKSINKIVEELFVDLKLIS